MHARFNLDAKYAGFKSYLDIGRELHSRNKAKVEKDLEVFKDADGVLQADKLVSSWFPDIKADVFLSHSHKDEELVIGFAGWLKSEFNLDSFIDSTVWGYSDTLLREIDNEYCMNQSGGTYNYDLRNRSTSHVHMMLSTALSHMIDRCECVIFVNTPSSFKPKDYLRDEGKTESPWIYSEIAMTRLIRQRSAAEHRASYRVKGAFDSAMESRSSDLVVHYPLDIYHLTPLDMIDIRSWANCKKKGVSALDALYDMKMEKLEYV